MKKRKVISIDEKTCKKIAKKILLDDPVVRLNKVFFQFKNSQDRICFSPDRGISLVHII